MTAGGFARRIGLEREIALKGLAIDTALPTSTRATIETLLAWLQRVVTTGVDVTDPVAIAGSNTIGDLLQAFPPALIPEGRAAFVAALLAPVAPPVTP